MNRPADRFGFRPSQLCALLAAVVVVAVAGPWAVGGVAAFRQQAVGGVMVEPGGLVRAATIDQRQEMLNALRARVDQPGGDLRQPADLRMVSLRRLQEAILQSQASGEVLPDDIQLLAGLQRVEYVFVYPDDNDIVLAGPAEPWMVRDDAAVVGVQSGRPPLMLDDLIVALRSVEPARQGGISCSIEPTAEGRQRLNGLLRRVRLNPGQDPRLLEPAMREAFGPQLVKLNGVPSDSRYARVLVAADFRMKQLAMHLTPSPVPALPSYLEMARNEQHAANQNPRWWMTCDYDALSRTEDKLAWRLTGQGVKTMTEIDRVAADGSVQPTGRTDKTASRWAQLMTDNFADLARAEPVFGDLRNLMDLSVVATLIVQEGLDQRAGCDLSLLMGRQQEIPVASYVTPTAVDPQCSFVRGRSGWTVTASGGVSVDSFEVVENQQVDATIAQRRQRGAETTAAGRWWWNG